MPTTSEREAIRAEHADSWIAVEVGDYIEGKVVEVISAYSDKRMGANGQRGSNYPLLVVKVEKATGYPAGIELKVHCFSTVMFNEIRKLRPAVGERITFTYQGQGEAKSGLNPPELYRLRVHDRPAERTYDDIFGPSLATQYVERARAENEARARNDAPPPTQVDEDIPF